MTGGERSIALRPDPTAPGRARHWVASSVDLDRERIERLKLLVSELVTNSVRHGSRSEDDEITLRLESGHGRVRLEVVDHGPPFTVEPVAPEPARYEGRGLGYVLVDLLADRWGIERDDVNIVWVELGADGHVR